jgi:hypothetical protein
VIIPEELWPKASETAEYLINKMLQKEPDKTLKDENETQDNISGS